MQIRRGGLTVDIDEAVMWMTIALWWVAERLA